MTEQEYVMNIKLRADELAKARADIASLRAENEGLRSALLAAAKAMRDRCEKAARAVANRVTSKLGEAAALEAAAAIAALPLNEEP